MSDTAEVGLCRYAWLKIMRCDGLPAKETGCPATKWNRCKVLACFGSFVCYSVPGVSFVTYMSGHTLKRVQRDLMMETDRWWCLDVPGTGFKLSIAHSSCHWIQIVKRSDVCVNFLFTCLLVMTMKRNSSGLRSPISAKNVLGKDLVEARLDREDTQRRKIVAETRF